MTDIIDIVRESAGRQITMKEVVRQLEKDGTSPSRASECLLEALESGQLVITKRYELEVVD